MSKGLAAVNVKGNRGSSNPFTTFRLQPFEKEDQGREGKSFKS